MKNKLLPLVLLFCASAAMAQEKITDVLADRALDMSRPADRAQAVKRIEAIENARLQNARAKGRAMGLALREEKPGGGVRELVDFVDGKPVYLETMNADAAISTAANLVQTSPYMLDGSGLTVAVWDAGGGRLTHQEFATGSRLTNMNGTYTHYHSMHVAGTIAALGVNPLSRGMANNAKINSYDWNSDVSEMISAGATASNQAATKVYLSNHSYGVPRGWNGSTWTGTGTNQNAYAIQFGQYGTPAQELDAAIYSTPYFLSFWSAGNERSNNPTIGSTVSIGGTTVVYDPAIHPPGDGVYRNGYETMGYRNLAKNIVTVGAVNDAVTSGLRDLSKATISWFSSTGPTDDGRIKPDLVANGVNLTSADIGADDDYLTISGTSMSSPNACGSATLLVDQYKRLFGGAMMAGTLKALLIQTADDIGNPGPDYFFGWGLINVKRAADLLIEQRDFPITQHVTEGQVSTTVTNRKYNFTWDGVSPIKATLAWTDPAGTATSAHDSRTPTLVNNLNLKLIAPNGTEYFPFVMPFVGQWTVASMSQNATTGINNVDNVEQVLVANPGQAGSWQVVVSYSGLLANSLQDFGLILSGSTTDDHPLVINSISPATGASGTSVTTDITGEELSADTVVRLRQPGRADIIGTSVQLLNPTTLRCQFNLGGAASGLWSVVGTNPDAKTATLADAFTITGTSITDLWSENFDATVSGWSSQSASGSNSWAITTAQSHSPTSSYFAAGPVTTSTTWLVSLPVAIPASYSNLQIEFWHQYDLQSERDGGRFSLSVDDGVTWFDVTDVDSGASFISNGYDTTMASTGQTGDFAGLQAWSGVSGGFVRTAIDLHNIPKFAGKNLRMRWGLSTNNQTASNGWHVDSVALVSDSSAPNHAPIITVAASTSSSETQTVGSTTYQIIRETGTALTVSATDDAGENDLVYTWTTSGPVAVNYNTSGNNSAKNASITFYATGDYIITASVRDTGGLTTTSSINVRVLANSSLRVTPDPAVVQITTTRQFSAVLADQFGAAAVTQPSPITWSVNGGGSMASNGLFTATTLGGPYVVTATGGAFSKNVDLTVTPLAKTFTGASSGSSDNWNIATRWTPSGVPNGPADVTIADGKVVTCDLDTTPTYSGDLTLGAGSLLQAGWGTNTLGVFNVFGSPATTTITMGARSKIATRGNFSPEIPAIVLIGDAEFSMGSSNPPGTDPDFKYGITGPYMLTLNGKSECSAKLSAPGNFGELYLSNQYGVNFTVDADVAGSLGGNVTMLVNPSTGGPCAILRANAANAMSDTATLNLYGNVGPLVTFNANDTIGSLVINGVKQPAGSYTSGSSWWLGGAGTVTVAGPVTAYWNPTGGPGGTWDASAIWNNQANLAGANSPWSAGQVANFNAAGNYGVSISGTQDIGGLAVSNGTVTMSGGGLRLIGAIPAPVSTGASLTIGTVISQGAAEGSLHKTGGGTLTLSANNTFTGPTHIGGGIVSVASLANSDVASPLGKYPYPGVGGLLLAGGTLQYTGGTATVDRGFTFSGNSTINISTPGTALTLGNSRTLNSSGTLSVTGGAGSTLSLGDFTSTAGMGITFNPTTVSMNVASLVGYSPYPLSSTFTLGGSSTGNVISGNVYASVYPGSAFQQGTTVVKSGTGDWTINGVFSTGGTLTVESGTLTLKGNNTIDGTTTLKGGKLVFDYTTNNSSKMAGALTLAGGTLELKNGTHSEAVSSTTLNAGPTTFITRNGGTARLRMNAITRNAGASLIFGAASIADADRTNTNGILGGYATIGANWVINSTNAGDGIITALSTYDAWTNSGGSATANYQLNGADTLGGALAANSLKIANTAISQTLNMGSNNLTITSTAAATLGGLLYAGGSDDKYTINGSGGLLASTTTGELIIHTHTGVLTVNAPVVTSAATAGLLTKTGAGSLILGGTNNVYTGATRVASGKLFVNGSLSDNTSTVTVESGAALGGSGTIGRHIVVATGGGFEFNLGTNAASHVPLTRLANRNLTFSGASVLTITSSGGATPGLYTLITGGNNVIGSAPATVILPPGWAADPPVISGNKLQINITTAVTNPNLPPVWTSNPVIESNATEGAAYSASLANDVTDANSNPLTFAKLSGPAWLNVGSNGALSGTPAYSNVGANVFTVNVSDGIAAPVTATLNITVDAAFSNPPVVGAGPDQTVSLVVGQPWTPAALAPLAWYDATDSLTVNASGGLVSQWSDKSGNANHMLPAGPTNQPATGTSNINGLNAIAFDGTSDALKTATNPFGASISNAMMMAVVDIGSVTNSTLFSLTGSSTAANRWQSHCPLAAGTIYFDCGGASGGNRVLVTPAPVWPANEKKLLGFYCSTSANVQRVWTNGSQLLGDVSGHTVNTVSGLCLGSDGGTSYDNCAMGEVVILNGVVSDADRQKLEGHLAWKWGLQANLPAGHPHIAVAPGGTAAVVTLDGTISDPDNDPFTSTWSLFSGPGSVNFTNASAADTTATFITPGTYVLRLTANDGRTQAFDDVIITINAAPGPVDHFEISPITSPQTMGTPITGITITAQDASNNTATGFTGTVNFSGTGGFTGTSAGFTNGVLTNPTSVMPTVAGSNLTLTVNDGAGHTGSTTIATINPAQSPYETWAVGGVAFDADTNGDGIKNGMAWLLGAADPSANALDKLPQASRNGAYLRLTFRCLKSTKRGSAQLKVQSSGDIGASDPWASHEAAVPDLDNTVNGVVFDTTDDGDFINVIADIPAAGANLFGRLQATP